MNTVTATRLRTIVGFSAYDLDNWVRHGHVECTVVDGKRRFTREDVFCLIAVQRLKELIPPSIATQMGKVLSRLDQDGSWNVGDILYFWLSDDGTYCVAANLHPSEVAISMPAFWFEAARDIS